ncbi:cytochrome P450 [Gonapodya prolifera JEL478]|uniref:Cytochrome P450 n=1 Tax=Gonapodya prolifera (strain JEL478) TaxID=1344416 RepID=A0A139A0U1_GONPJ|nr:cytochrome P450 [Gonapodya prolifera JEL478]|eukprot:KXS10396.1 cytochrome P450 [Gonapodya prolifera JEL478]
MPLLSTVAVAIAGLYLVYEIFRRLFLDYGDDVPTSIGIPLINDPAITDVPQFHIKMLEKARATGHSVRRSVMPWKPWRSTVYVGHPQVLREIYVGKDWEAFDRPIKSQDPSQLYHAGGLILVPNGKNWRGARELFGKTFANTTIKTYMPIFADKLAVLIDLIGKEAKKNPSGFDIQAFYSRYTFDMITRLSFGEEMDVQHDFDSKYMKAWDDVLSISVIWQLGANVAGNWAFPGFLKAKHQASYKVITKIILDGLANARAAKAAGAKTKNTRFSIVDDMLTHELPEFMEKDENEIVKQLMTLLFAGHDTTAATMSFLTYYLSLNPEWRKLIRDEVNAAVKPSDALTLETVESFKYIGAAIKETLRHHPAAPVGTGRQMNRDLTVTYADKNGASRVANFKKGDIVFTDIYTTQMTQEFWNKPVDVWDPSRWLDDPLGGASSPFAFAPFGNGARKCLGERLALALTRLTLCEILRKYDIQRADDPTGKFKFVQNFTGTIKAENGVGVKLVPV